MKNGFTLVELSIVLVIIGLLIGGILASESIISTSKINSTVSQIQQFDAGVANFHTKYGYLPGDAPSLGGNGNGLIAFNAADVNLFAQEIPKAWPSIFPEQYTMCAGTCAYPGTAAVYSGSNKNVPLAKIGKKNSFFLLTGVSAFPGNQTTATLATPLHYYVILDASQIQAEIAGPGSGYRPATTTSANSAVRPSELIALDKKLDDGVADTGEVLSGSVGSDGTGGGAPNRVEQANCSSSGRYTLTNSGYECTPLIRVGSQSGMLE